MPMVNGDEHPPRKEGWFMHTSDPFMGALLGGDWSLINELMETMTRATLLEGELYVVRDETGTIASTALWFPLCKSMFST